MRSLFGWLVAMSSLSCAAHTAAEPPTPAVRWLDPSQTRPHGQAPGVRARLLTTQPDGTKTYAVVLSPGDEVCTALAAFATEHQVVNAHYSAIGAVRDPEVAWFDADRKQYKAMLVHEQMEVLALSGDIALGVDGRPIVHVHVALGRSDGRSWGGHLIGATTSPTLELYMTTYAEPLRKRLDPATGLQLIDPTISP